MHGSIYLVNIVDEQYSMKILFFFIFHFILFIFISITLILPLYTLRLLPSMLPFSAYKFSNPHTSTLRLPHPCTTAWIDTSLLLDGVRQINFRRWDVCFDGDAFRIIIWWKKYMWCVLWVRASWGCYHQTHMWKLPMVAFRWKNAKSCVSPKCHQIFYFDWKNRLPTYIPSFSKRRIGDEGLFPGGWGKYKLRE